MELSENRLIWHTAEIMKMFKLKSQEVRTLGAILKVTKVCNTFLWTKKDIGRLNRFLRK